MVAGKSVTGFCPTQAPYCVWVWGLCCCRGSPHSAQKRRVGCRQAPLLPENCCLHAGLATRRLRRPFPWLQHLIEAAAYLTVSVCEARGPCLQPGSRGGDEIGPVLIQAGSSHVPSPHCLHGCASLSRAQLGLSAALFAAGWLPVWSLPTERWQGPAQFWDSPQPFPSGSWCQAQDAVGAGSHQALVLVGSVQLHPA